jgi:phosphoribosylformylglycinamidine cyclo-ligase
VVERSRIVDGRAIRPGDALLGLASSGAHSNGYSLIRRIVAGPSVKSDFTLRVGGAALGDALMAPTRIYAKSVLKLLAEVPVKGLAHITGGGLTGNVPRMLPEGARAAISKASWRRPALFDWLQEKGGVAEDEMHRVFNCGIGMVIALERGEAQRAAALLRAEGETVYEIGSIEAGPAGEPQAVIT